MTHNADVKAKWIEDFKIAFLAPFHEDERAHPEVIILASETAELSWDRSNDGEADPEEAAGEEIDAWVD